MSDSLLTRAWYEQDFARVMGAVCVVMTTGQAGNDQQAQALTLTEERLAALSESGVPAPDDLAAATSARVSEVRAMYQAQYDAARQVIDLTPEQQAALGVNVAHAQQAATTAMSWLLGIDAVEQMEVL